MSAILREMFAILNEMAAYLLLGFLLAGLLHVALLKRKRLLAPLSGGGARAVFLAALIGAPLPLCSCSVLPTGVTLRRRGASKGAVAAFLITCPETDVLSILLTYGLIGPLLAIYRPIAALVTGVCTGLMVNLVDRRWGRPAAETSPSAMPAAETIHSGHQGHSEDGEVGGPMAPGGQEAEAAGRSSPKARGWLAEVWHYGFVEFFDDLIGQLLLGLVLGAAIAAFLPALNLTRYAGHHLLGYLAMFVLGIPLYVCASASTPIAAGLIAGGISPGAALVFLLVGSANNFAAFVVLLRQFGRLVLAVYLSMIAVLSVVLGVLLDLLLQSGRVHLPVVSPVAVERSSPLAVVGTVLFLALVAASALRRRLPARFHRYLERISGQRIPARALAAAAGGLGLLFYLASGLFLVGAGERAAVTCFGSLREPFLGPGAHYHWPAPFGGVDRVSTRRIHRVEIGFRSSPSAAASLSPAPQDEGAVKPGELAVHGSPTESWLVTGDENIVDLQAVAQYQVLDEPASVRRYLYEVRDADLLVRDTAVWALSVATGGRSIDSLLTSARAQVETQVERELLQPALDGCGSGVRVVGFQLLSVHAPTPVHAAFRDVAGAAEDAAKYINEARAGAERMVREAEGDSARGVLLSRGEATTRVDQAGGEASSFLAQSREYRRAKTLTRSRLYLETLEKVLPRLGLYLDLTGTHGRGPSIWVKRGPGWEGVPPPGANAGGAPESTPSPELPKGSEGNQ